MFNSLKKYTIYLLNYFAPDRLKKKHLCGINIEINYDDSINIHCNWPNFDSINSQHLETIAKKYGTMLFMINNGLLKEDIIDTLIKFDDINNKYDAEFVNISLQEWLDLFTQNTHNTPLIKPSSVFKNYK